MKAADVSEELKSAARSVEKEVNAVQEEVNAAAHQIKEETQTH